MTIKSFMLGAAALAVVATITTPAARAATLGAAIDAMSPEEFASLANAPASALGAVAELAAAAGQWNGNGKKDDAAVVAATRAVIELTAAQDELRQAPELTQFMVLQLASAVMASDVRRVIESSHGRPGPTEGLAIAVSDWIHGQATNPLAPMAGSDGPDSPCAQQLADCYVYCSERRTWVDR